MKAITTLMPLAVALFTLFAPPKAITAAKPTEAYFPLAEGVEWTMDMVMTTDDGRQFHGVGRRVVGAAETLNGKTYFRVRTWWEAEGLPRQERSTLSRKDYAGFHTIYLPAPGAQEEPEIVLPMKVGARWKTKHLSGTPLTHEVKGMETVVIGGKTYADCYHIQVTADDGSHTEDFWEAPGVGSVKTEVRFRGGKGVMTLREFKAGKPAGK